MARKRRKNDGHERQIPLFTNGRWQVITVADYEQARAVGTYMGAVGNFLRTNEIDYLTPHQGLGIRDVNGLFHPFETRPNVVYRLAFDQPEPYEQIYRIVR